MNQIWVGVGTRSALGWFLCMECELDLGSWVWWWLCLLVSWVLPFFSSHIQHQHHQLLLELHLHRHLLLTLLCKISNTQKPKLLNFSIIFPKFPPLVLILKTQKPNLLNFSTRVFHPVISSKQIYQLANNITVFWCFHSGRFG